VRPLSANRVCFFTQRRQRANLLRSGLAFYQLTQEE